MQVRNDILIALRVVNSARFASGIRGAVRSVSEFHWAMDQARSSSEKFTAAGHLLTGGMGLLGSAFKGLVYTLGAVTAATVGFGIQFNATMESNNLAFEKFAGSAESARMLTKELFTIAANTPFSFEDVTTAGRRLLAFGFNVQETTDLLKVMGDTISYTGGSTDEILRLGKALGDIRAKGKLMQQEMNQLANVGIPIRDVLAKGGLELTERQLTNIGRAGIPADQAITAIKAGLQSMYGGGAAKYLETFNGQVQRLRDNLKSTAGAATRPLFDWAKGALKSGNDKTGGITKFFQGPQWTKITGTLGKLAKQGFGILVGAVKQLWDAFKPIAPFLTNILWPVLKGIGIAIMGTIVVAFEILVFTIKIISTVLGWLGKKLAFLGPVLYAVGWIIGTFFGGEIVKVLGWLGKTFPFFAKLAKYVGFLVAPIRFVGVVLLGYYKILGKVFLFIGGYVLKALIRFIPALVKVGAVFVKLQSSIGKFFFKMLSGIVNVLARLPSRLGNFLFDIGSKIIGYVFGGMKEKLAKVFIGGFALAAQLGRSLKDWLNAHTLFGNEINLGFTKIRIPKLAKGGMFTGMALVGEQGPELAQHTPGGTVITPLRGRKGMTGGGRMGSGGPSFDSIRAYFEIPIYIDRSGRGKIAEAVGEYQSDRKSVA